MITKTLSTADLISLRDKKLLLAFSRNKQAWYLPGGKVDAGEISIEALQREIEEELTLSIKTEELHYYCHISAPAYGENKNLIMEQDCFLYELHKEIVPTNEIEAVRFFSLDEYKSEPAQVVGVLDVFEKLIADGLAT